MHSFSEWTVPEVEDAASRESAVGSSLSQCPGWELDGKDVWISSHMDLLTRKQALSAQKHKADCECSLGDTFPQTLLNWTGSL